MDFVITLLIGLVGLLVHIYLKYNDSRHKRKVAFEESQKGKKRKKKYVPLTFVEYVKINKERLTGSLTSYLILYIIIYFKLYLQFSFLHWIEALVTGDYTVYFIIGYFADSIIRNIVIAINNIKIDMAAPAPAAKDTEEV